MNGLIGYFDMEIVETRYRTRTMMSVNYEGLGVEQHDDIAFIAMDDAKKYLDKYHEGKGKPIEWNGKFGHLAFGDDDCKVTYEFVIEEMPIVTRKG